MRTIKVKLKVNSPHSGFGYYERGDTGELIGFTGTCAIVLKDDGCFVKVEPINMEKYKEPGQRELAKISDQEEIVEHPKVPIVETKDGGLWNGGTKTNTDKPVCTGIGDPKEESGVLGGMIREMKEGPVSEELEEAARRYAGIPEDSPHDLNYCVQDKKAKYDAVLFGAKWQKQQMMKGAKGGTVQEDFQVILDDGAYIDLDPSMQLKPSFDVKEGQRVKLIIIKED